MTNHIDEMMKMAGVNGKIISCDANCPYYKFNIACYSDDKGNIPCPIEYPDFTAEKQLEIIKLILKSDDIDELNQYYSEIRKCYVFNALSLPDELGFKSSWTAENKNYDLALAELVVMLMNAGELDKEKVKEVLEGC